MASNFNKIFSDIKKQYTQSIGNIDSAGVITRVPVSSPKLNYVLGGGIPVGRILEILGPSSGGKTTLASYLAGQIQQRKDGGANKILYVDMEYAFDRNHAKTVGLDTNEDKFIFVQPLSGEEGFTICEQLLQTGEIGGIVWDSVAATPSQAVMDTEFGKASFGGTARVMSDGLKKLNPYIARYKVASIFLNQIRAKVGGMPGYGPQENTQVGGYALPFYASWISRVSKAESIMDKKEVIGITINLKNTKSKISIPYRSAKLDLYFSTGFDTDLEYLDFVINLGLVRVAGSWLSNEDWGFKGQGRDSLLDFLKKNPSLFEDVKNQINESFTGNTIIDANETPVNEEGEAYVED